MTVRFYSFEDTGAPALPNVTSQRFFDNLKLILMACLVNGYGGKPAAGWTLGHDHADGFSLSNGEGFVNFVSTAVNIVDLYAIEVIADGSTALAGGYNRRSGSWFDGLATPSRQRFRTALSGTTAGKRWYVVADEHTAIVKVSGGQSLDPNVSDSGAIYFGRFSDVNGAPGFCVLGGSFTNAAGGGYLTATANRNGCVLRNPYTGLMGQGEDSGYGIAIATAGTPSTSINAARLAPASHRLNVIRASINASGSVLSGSSSSTLQRACGLSRGVLAIPELADLYSAVVLPYLGISSPTADDRFRPISMPNGQQYVPLYASVGDLGAFISLNPADWE